MTKKSKILFAIDSPGPADLIVHTLPFIKEKADISIVTVGESPTKRLEEYNPVRCDEVSGVKTIYKDINPDVLIICTSSLVFGPYVNNKLTSLAYKDKKKIICFQDFWANHRWPMNLKMMDYCDAFLTIDDLAKDFIMEDGYKGKVIVSGNPAFDKFIETDLHKERSRLKKEFKLKGEDKVIIYIGQGVPGLYEEDKETFTFLCDSIRAMKDDNIVLIVRPHPRSEDISHYLENSKGVRVLNTDEFKLSNDLLPVADAVVSMYATNLIHSSLLQIPSVSILLPTAGGKTLLKIFLDDFPLNKTGMTIGVYSKDTNELVEVLNQAFLDSRMREEEKWVKKDLKTAEKMAGEILKLV